MYVPDGVEAVVEIVSVEVYDRPGWTERVLGLSDRVGAFAGDGEMESVNVTVPVSPMLVT